MRIAVVVHNDVRRDARVLKEAGTLARAGHHVSIYGLAEEADAFTVHDGAVPVRLVARTKAGRDRSNLSNELLAEASRIARERDERVVERDVERVLRSFLHQGTLLARAVLDEGTAQVVHLHDHVSLTAAFLYAEELGVPLVWDAHEIYEELAGVQDARRFANPAIISVNQHRIDGFVTINDAIAGYYADRYPGLPKATVLPNAAVLAAEGMPSYDGRLHAAAGLSHDRRILLFQGGLSPHRGIDALLDAAPDLPDGWSVVFMGWGPLADRIEHAASALPMDGAARIARIDGAPQSELPLWTAGATLGAIPYENTSLNHLYCTPNKLWEYPIAGVPILASDLEELGRAVRDHGIGTLVPREFSGADIVGAVSALFDEALSQMRKACGRFVETSNWSAIEERLVATYETLPAAGVGRNVPPRETKAAVSGDIPNIPQPTSTPRNSTSNIKAFFKTAVGRLRPSSEPVSDAKLRARLEALEHSKAKLIERNNSLKSTVGELREKLRDADSSRSAKVRSRIRNLELANLKAAERNEMPERKIDEVRRNGQSTGRDSYDQLQSRIESLESSKRAILDRNETLKQTVATLRENVRNARVDTRDIDPFSHNSSEVMDSFFGEEVDHADSDKPYREFAAALKETLRHHGVELKDRQIFDAGIGNGEMLRALLDGVEYGSVAGMDFSSVGIERANAAMPDGAFRVGNLMEPIGERFEVVFCTEVLEHLPEPATALRNVLGAVAPGGVAILTVPDGRVDYSKLHINFWSPESWRGFVSANADALDCTFDTFRVRPTALYEQNLAIVRRSKTVA